MWVWGVVVGVWGDGLCDGVATRAGVDGSPEVVVWGVEAEAVVVSVCESVGEVAECFDVVEGVVEGVVVGDDFVDVL